MFWKNFKLYKIKLYWGLYWIRILLGTLLALLGIALSMVIINGIRAWHQAESYLRRTQLATYPLQILIWITVGIIQGMVFVFMYHWVFMKRGFSSFTQMHKKSIAGEKIGITWNDVIGMDEAKREALEVVNLIKDRAELQRIGGKILRGLLLVGPPGCGKTYLAKAIATEAKIPFISMSGSEFVEMFVGVGAGRIRSLFKRARILAEFEGGCIVFIDEIDALGARRALDAGFGGTAEHNTTLNQLLVEMDGLKEKDLNVVIIGATNVWEGYLDSALLRPGRFDRKIYVDKPNLEDREKLFAYYLAKVKYDENDVKIDRLARITVGNSPADIANLVRESALIAVRNKRQFITMKDIDEARERISLGIRRRFKYSPEEKWQTAYHEAGHAIVTYLLVPRKDVFKVTVTPRGHTGGVTWTPERIEILIENKNQLLEEIKICLGSYVAEKIQYGFTTVGVSGDFSNAYYYAHHMAWSWGMGKSGVIGDIHALDFYGWGGRTFVSEEMKARLDNDTQEILRDCLIEVENLLRQEKPLLDRIAKELFEKDELNYDEIEAIFKEFGKSRPSL